MRVNLRLAAVAAGLLVAVAVLAPSASAATTPDRYIVVLKDSIKEPGAVASEHARALDVQKTQVYRHALTGYAAAMSDAAAERLRSDPRVLSVSRDGWMRLAGKVPPCNDLTTCQLLGNGPNRIDADSSSARSGDGAGSVPVNVAVLDSGIQPDHPDLDVVGGRDCADGTSFYDQDGHGTMVAGFIGALDNSLGRVGVAPGARLWAVRVARRDGFVADSWLVCGLDFVAGTRADSDPANDIAVANMSLGGPAREESDCASARWPPHIAICNVQRAGVVQVAAAGNESADFRSLYPAGYDEVLAVTATADNDGQPGGLGGQLNCLPETDDTEAFFSNFATLAADRAHTVAAPGACINSTFIGGEYATGSGTSFASPLVAGTVALCVHGGACAGLRPHQVVQKIVADARTYNESRKGSGYGFRGDPVRPIAGKYYGYLIRAGLY